MRRKMQNEMKKMSFRSVKKGGGAPRGTNAAEGMLSTRTCGYFWNECNYFNWPNVNEWRVLERDQPSSKSGPVCSYLSRLFTCTYNNRLEVEQIEKRIIKHKMSRRHSQNHPVIFNSYQILIWWQFHKIASSLCWSYYHGTNSSCTNSDIESLIL